MCCTMKFIILLLIIVTLKGVHLTDDCPAGSSSTEYSKLKSMVLCDYDPFTRPVADHGNATQDPSISTLDIDAWMRLDWRDEHLKWDHQNHKNINSLFFDTYEIWTPDLSIYNRAVQGDTSVLGNTNCEVSNNGSVLCIYSVHVDSLCVPDLRYYPYDRQNCDLRIGSWMHKGQEMDFKLTKDMLILSTMEPNGEWEIESYVSKKYGGVYPFMELSFKLKRLHAAHTATVIIPSLVAILLTLTSLSLSPKDADRLLLCYINLVVQFIHIQNLSWQLPLKGDQVPYLLVFARDSLLMAAFAIAFTYLFKNIMQRQTLPPLWISSFVSFFTGCVLGRYLFLDDYTTKGVAAVRGEEDGAAIIESKKKNFPDWQLFANILDWIFLTCYVIVYFVMFIKYIP